MESDLSKQCGSPIVEVGLGIVVRETPRDVRMPRSVREILVTLRPSETVYGDWWEIPGGKVDPGETIDECVVRELREEVGLEVAVTGALPDCDVPVHVYDHATVRLHPRLCRAASDARPQNLSVADHRWVDAGVLEVMSFPPANKPVIAALIRWLRAGEAAEA